MKPIKKKFRISYISMIHCLVIFMVWIVGACDDCQGKKESSGNLTLAVNHTTLVGNDQDFVLTLNNQKDESVTLDNYKLRAGIKNEQGGAGSTFAYTTAAGEKMTPMSMDEKLSHFTNTETLESAATENLNFSITPAQGVKELTITLQLYDLEDKKLVGDPIEINWSAATAPPTLKLEEATGARNDYRGGIRMQFQQDVNPQEIEVSLTSNNQATFIFNNSRSTCLLSELLMNSTATIKAGDYKTIEYRLENAHEETQADVTIAFKKSNIVLGSYPVDWKQKDLALASFEAEYDPVNKRIHYIIEKTGQDAIEASDNIILVFVKKQPNNQAVIQPLDPTNQIIRDGKIEVKIIDDSKLIGDFGVEFNNEQEVNFAYQLGYGMSEMGELKTIHIVKQEQS